MALKELRARNKDITDQALAQLVACVGPHSRQLISEIEKLSLYVGDRSEIGPKDVDAIVTRTKQARAFALGDALGDRNLPKLLKALDEELWEMQFDKQKSEIGILYGLISKVRTMLLIQEMLKAGWIKPESDYTRFKTQLERVPVEELPKDKRFNPLAINPYVLFKAVAQSRNYTSEELVQAMDLLLRCNRKLVMSGLEGSLVLQQTLAQIVTRPATKPATPILAGRR
ncbi:MAG TPA: hypothetical protein VK968_01160 [Roseimicrobium sp.]|nr:hypothetical protein [Roseimicrobium sp.]